MRQKGDKAEDRPVAGQPCIGFGAGKRILVVHTDGNVLNLLDGVLSIMGFAVDTCDGTPDNPAGLYVGPYDLAIVQYDLARSSHWRAFLNRLHGESGLAMVWVAEKPTRHGIVYEYICRSDPIVCRPLALLSTQRLAFRLLGAPRRPPHLGTQGDHAKATGGVSVSA